MRIIQIIDSLEPGGAERMAVNYANSLLDKIEFSGLVATRAEGSLKNKIDKNVDYFFLERKKTIDITALLKFKKIIKLNGVEIIHAHSSSCFFAFLLKLIYPKIKIIWHDHYGNSEFLYKRKKFLLKLQSILFEGIIVVNHDLKRWNSKHLSCVKIKYFPNFALNDSNSPTVTILKGESKKRIVCLANLRPQKGHFILLGAAREIINSHSDWTFHLIGKNFKDDYSKSVEAKILELNLEENVFIYDSCEDISAILQQVDIGVLTSLSEGLPVALLEYGINKLPVVVTNVGEVSSIIQNGVNGFLIDSNDIESFTVFLKKIIESDELKVKFAKELAMTIKDSYSKDVIIENYLSWLKIK
jgi:glycosyltransferase involved in cell wall biosynthesis